MGVEPRSGAAKSRRRRCNAAVRLDRRRTGGTAITAPLATNGEPTEKPRVSSLKSFIAKRHPDDGTGIIVLAGMVYWTE